MKEHLPSASMLFGFVLLWLSGFSLAVLKHEWNPSMMPIRGWVSRLLFIKKAEYVSIEGFALQVWVYIISIPAFFGLLSKDEYVRHKVDMIYFDAIRLTIIIMGAYSLLVLAKYYKNKRG